MVLESLGRRKRQGEIHFFRDETRKSKCLRKSSAEVAFPAIPPQREQELAVASQAAPLLPAARPWAVLLWMAEGGWHVGWTKMSLPPLLHPRPPNKEAGVKAWLTGWCRMHWMSGGQNFTQDPFCHVMLQTHCSARSLQVSYTDPKTSHRPPMVLTRLRVFTRAAGQDCIIASPLEIVTLQGSEQAQILLLLPQLYLEYIHGLIPSPQEDLRFSLPSLHEGIRHRFSFLGSNL